MKTINQMRNAECGMRNGQNIQHSTAEARPAVNIQHRRNAFTLIELLTVIAVMTILAAFSLVVVGAISRHKYISVATAELGQIQSALEDYKAKYGVYPPSNANPTGTYASPVTNSLLPQLYYELCGVTNNNGTYVTLDGSAQIPAGSVQQAFGVGGFVNCSKGSGDEGTVAKNFLLGLRQTQMGTVNDNGVAITNLITSVGGRDAVYTPLGLLPGNPSVNPIRYVYPGVNNPNSYDLWVQLRISGKTNLICNWSKNVIINSALP